jgi:phage tail-like protein
MANTQFVVNATHFDPLKNFKFRVWWDRKMVAGISKVSVLKESTEVVTHRDGGDNNMPHLTPSVFKSEPITMERGISYDLEFETWARLVWNMKGEPSISLKNFRKEITIQLLNEQGVVAKSYIVHRCWVSEYQALPELDANTHVVAIEKLVLQNEGWERDPDFKEQPHT